MIPDINLLPKVNKRQTNSKVIYYILAITTVLVLAVLILQYFGAKSDITLLQSQEQSLLSQRDQLQAELSALTNADTGSLEQSVEFVELVSYPVTPLIDEISSIQPSHSYLREYSFSESSIAISADFETLSDVSTFVSRLTNSDYFQDAQVSSITNFNLGNDSTEDAETTDYNVIPRYSVSVSLMIDENYLASGGNHHEINLQ